MLDFLKYIKCGPWWTCSLGHSSLVSGMGEARAGPEQGFPVRQAQVSACTELKDCAVSEIEVRSWYLRDPVRYGDGASNPIMWLDFNLLGSLLLIDLEFPFTMKQKKKVSVSNGVTFSCSEITPKRVLKEKSYFKYILFIYFYKVLHDPSIKFKVYKNYSVKKCLCYVLSPAIQLFPKATIVTSFVCVFTEAILCIYHLNIYIYIVMHSIFSPLNIIWRFHTILVHLELP